MALNKQIKDTTNVLFDTISATGTNKQQIEDLLTSADKEEKLASLTSAQNTISTVMLEDFRNINKT